MLKTKMATLFTLIVLFGIIAVHVGSSLHKNEFIFPSSGIIDYGTVGIRPLHTEGAHLVNDLGERVHLHGVCKNEFVERGDGAFGGIGSTLEEIYRYNLQTLQNWGCNFIALAVEPVQYLNNRDYCRDNIKFFVQLAKEYGIYVGIGVFGYSNTGYGTGSGAGPWASTAAGRAIIDPANTPTYYDFWSEVSDDFQNVPNVIYAVPCEVLWCAKRPAGETYCLSDAEMETYYNIHVQVVQMLRGRGDDHPFMYHEGYTGPVYFDVGDRTNPFVDKSQANIVHPLHLESGCTNIIYDAHVYRYSGHFGHNPDYFAWSPPPYVDANGVYRYDADSPVFPDRNPQQAGIETATRFWGWTRILEHYKVPIVVWEGGAVLSSSSLEQEKQCWANYLRWLNRLDVGYGAFWWRYTAPYSLFRYGQGGAIETGGPTATDNWGQVLIDNIWPAGLL